MKVKLFLLVLFLVFLGGCGRLENSNEKKEINSRPQKVQINQAVFILQLATTPSELQQGLSNQASLPEDHGMLFLFPSSQARAFWMKEMLFPLDIVWIDNNQVVGVSANLPPPLPDQPLPLYYSPQPVNRVLEINAGLAEKWNIKKGDHIKYLPLTQ